MYLYGIWPWLLPEGHGRSHGCGHGYVSASPLTRNTLAKKENKGYSDLHLEHVGIMPTQRTTSPRHLSSIYNCGGAAFGGAPGALRAPGIAILNRFRPFWDCFGTFFIVSGPVLTVLWPGLGLFSAPLSGSPI